MENKALTGLIGLVCILLGFGGSQIIPEDVVDQTYVCSINEKLGVFDRLSSTSKTGYYIDQYGIEKGKVCRGGIWVLIDEYAAMKGVDPDSYLTQQTETKTIIIYEYHIGEQHLCSVSGCTRIK